MIKFLHAADLHLDAAFSGLSPNEAKLRREEQRDLLTQMAELANAEQCDLMLLAGDLFDSDNAFADTIEAMQRAFAAFRGRIFIAPGNHDRLRRGSAYLSAAWPENVRIFRSQEFSCAELPELGCRIYGAGFVDAEVPSLLKGFRAEQDGLASLMVLHGDCLSADSPYNPVTKEQIADSGLDYLALGHIHMRGEARQGKTLCAWPGCAMGRGFDETGEKGVLIGTIGEDGCEVRFAPLDSRRYEELKVKAGDDPLSAIIRALPAGTERDIYRIRLTGESAPVDVSALYHALKERFFALQIKDRTTRKTDLWKGCGDETLRGQFLLLMRQKLDGAQTEAEKEKICEAARLGIRAIEGREEESV